MAAVIQDAPGVAHATAVRHTFERQWARTFDAMALVTRTYLTGDIDGSESDVSTVRIAPLHKTSYEINLSAAKRSPAS